MIFRPLDGGGLTYAISVLSGKITEKFNALAKVARSGNYIDLTNRPSIPPAVAVKGNAESEYRTGEVNLTPENIGLGNVNNTSDADKPISTAQQEEFNKKVNKTDVMQGATASAAGKAGLVPAPGTGNPDAVLKSNGTWAEGTYRSLGEVSVSGWYRIFSKTTSAVAGSGDAFMLTVSRGYSNNPPENFRVVCSTKYNSAQWCWHTLSSMVTSSKFVDKVRAAKKGNLLYIEVHYTANVGNTISFEMSYNSGFGTFLQEPRQALNFEPATEDETVISEYTIPDKDDFDTSKSLTRFTEIPEGANMNTYLTPGNYACSDSNKAMALKNCPLKTAFTLEVSYGINDKSYIFHRYCAYAGETVAVKLYNKYSGAFGTTKYYYPSIGTPPANKLWGTDANGNVGWIDPPLGNVFVSEHNHNSVGYVKFATITVRNTGWSLQPLIMDFLRYAGFYTKLIYSANSGLLRTDANLIVSNIAIEDIEIMCVETSSAVTDLYVHVGNGSAISTAVVVNPYDVYRIEFHDFTSAEAITRESVEALGTKVYSSKRSSVA